MGFRGAAVDIVDNPSLKIVSLRICETQIESLIASQLHQHPLTAFNVTPRHTRQVLFHNSTFPNGTPINSPSPFDLLPNYLLQIFFPLVQAPHISVTGNTPHPPHLPSLLNPISHTYPSKPPIPRHKTLQTTSKIDPQKPVQSKQCTQVQRSIIE